MTKTIILVFAARENLARRQKDDINEFPMRDEQVNTRFSALAESFTCTWAATRTVFGRGKSASLAEEAKRLGVKKVMVIAAPRAQAQTRAAIDALGGALAGVFNEAVMHVPEEVAQRASSRAREWRADCCAAIGGGSAVGVGKAVALSEGLPLLAVPTTYAGSEMTPIWGMTSGGVKRTGRDEKVRPRTVIYDADLLDDLPDALVGPSALNAMAHCVEAMYAADGNPVVSLLAEDGLRALAAGARERFGAGADKTARMRATEKMLYGAWLAGAVLGMAGMGLHHKLCHILGGGFQLPHAETHAVILPHAAAYNREAAPLAMARAAAALGEDDAAAGLYKTGRAVGAPAGLRDLGMKESDLPRALEMALENPYTNPAPVEREPLEQLLQNAFAGAHPALAETGKEKAA